MSNSKMGAKYPAVTGLHAYRHKKCRDGERCTGPGCKVRTGKTEGKRWNKQRKAATT